MYLLRKILPELFITLVLVMTACGLIMTYSSSVFYAYDVFNAPLYFFHRSLVWGVLGICAAGVMRVVHYQTVQKYSFPILLGVTILLLLTLVPGIGHRVNNASRWIRVAGLTFQPSEAAKYAIVLYVAHYISLTQRHTHHFMRAIGVPLAIIAVPLGLILIGPDLGTPIVILCTVCILFYIGGARISHLIMLGAAAVPIGVYFILRFPYRVERFLTFLHPERDPLGAGFQIRQSLIAISSGRIHGVGLGRSLQKIHYLPEAHTDFVFAILGEEHGFVGAAGVLILFLIFLYIVYLISRHVHDVFGHLVVCGFMILIGLQAVINIGVVTGCLPTKGLALPFISYGGSSLVMTLAACGMILNILDSQTSLQYYSAHAQGRNLTEI